LEIADAVMGSPLKVAIINNDRAMLELLLELGANPNFAPKGIGGPLAEAAMRRDLHAVRLLIAAGADVNAADRDGTSPLSSALCQTDLPIVRTLVEAGADVFKRNKFGVNALAIADAENNRQLKEYLQQVAGDRADSASLLDAAKLGSADAVRKLLPSASSQERRDAAIAATEEGRAEVLSLLLEAGVDPNTERPKGQWIRPVWPLLFIAIEGKHEAVIEALLAAGADVNAKAEYDGVRDVAPIRIAATQSLKLVKKLLQAGADLSQRDAAGHTALSIAKARDKQPIIRFLEPLYARLEAQTLHDAARDGDLAGVERLMAAGPNIDARDREGFTPLMVAVSVGQIEVARLLLERGASSAVASKTGQSLWILAMHSRAPVESAKLLLGSGRPLHSLLGPDGEPADVAELWGDALWSDRAAEVTPLLLAAGLEPNARLKDGFTPLLCAVAHGGKDVAQVLKQLLAAGADAEAVYEEVSGPPAEALVELVLQQLKAGGGAKGRAIYDRWKSSPPDEAIAGLKKLGLPFPIRRTVRQTVLEFAKRQSKKAYDFLREHLQAAPDPYDQASGELANLKGAAQDPRFQALAAEIGGALGARAQPWKKRAGVMHFMAPLQRVATASKLRMEDPTLLVDLRQRAIAHNATLVYAAQPEDNRNLWRLLLFPTRSWAAVLRACGTNGVNRGLGVREVVNWFAEAEKTNPFELTGCGFDFVEVRFATPVANPAELLRKSFEFCPEGDPTTSEKEIAEFAADGRSFFWWD
jgi:ankyrin repeat protein